MSQLFTPGRIGQLALRNRIVMSPMQQYRGDPQGHATEYHRHHYARPAQGGAALIIVESTAVAVEGRLFADDLGLFDDSQVAPLRAVVGAVHAAGAAIAVQLSHGGRKALSSAGVPLLAPSALAYDAEHGMPRVMTAADLARLVAQFAAAARRAQAAGFDAIELHAAHGYLIHQFLSPLSNERSDAYGGSIEARGRLLREVFQAVRAAVGPGYPLLVRVSASDYAPGGLTPSDVAAQLRPLLAMGLDAVDVSSGALRPSDRPEVGPGYQVAFAAEIRAALGIPVIAIGLIRGGEAAEAILLAGQADFIAFGRPFLERPDYALDLRCQLDGPRAQPGRSAAPLQRATTCSRRA
jgi:NADPH2 dehydrogenase